MKFEFQKNILQMRNLAAEDYLRKHSGISIPNIADDTMKKVRQILEKGMMQGANPHAVGLELVGRIDPITNLRVGGIIGLPKVKIAEVAKAKKYLEDLDEAYLSLELRDKRYDRSVKKSLNLRKPLLQDQINRIILIYENRALLNYGQGIAQTAMMRSINHMEYVSNAKLILEGLIKQECVTKEWDDCGDGKVRPTHALMGIKYGKGKGLPLEEPFISPSGARLMYPCDTSLGAPFEEIERCRCRVHYRVNWLERGE